VEAWDGFHLHWRHLRPILWGRVCCILYRSSDVRPASSVRKRSFSHQWQRNNQGRLCCRLQVQPWLPDRGDQVSDLPAVEQRGLLAARRSTGRVHKTVNGEKIKIEAVEN